MGLSADAHRPAVWQDSASQLCPVCESRLSV